jgi:polyisoprenoid-binding protein YceI
MRRKLQIVISVVAALAILSISAFMYLTRDIAAPSTDVQSTVQELATSDESGSETIFRISSDESEVTYTINEVLNGADKTVVGATSEVAGDILVNLSDPSLSEIGEISINARTFETDEDRRDNSVARFILQSEDAANEFITFVQTSISGLPESVSVGDTLELEVTGNLTIAGVTNEVTFTTTGTLESAVKLVGQAETTVAYADFNLTIPDVPFVASVEDTVILSLNFVANAVTDAA